MNIRSIMEHPFARDLPCSLWWSMDYLHPGCAYRTRNLRATVGVLGKYQVKQGMVFEIALFIGYDKGLFCMKLHGWMGIINNHMIGKPIMNRYVYICTYFSCWAKMIVSWLVRIDMDRLFCLSSIKCSWRFNKDIPPMWPSNLLVINVVNYIPLIGIIEPYHW